MALAGVAGGAYAAARSGRSLTFDAISCYQNTNVSTEPAVFAPANGNSPLAQCAHLWRQGKVGPTRTPPPLVACYRTGEVTVLPGTSTAVCGRLGLAGLPADYANQVNNDLAFEAALTARLSGCPSAPTARRVAQELLATHGRSSWRVVVDPPDRYSGPCTNTFAVDQSNGRSNGILVLGQTIRPLPHPTASQQHRPVCSSRTTGTRRLLDNIDCELLQAAPPGACVSIETAFAIAKRELAAEKRDWRVTIDHYTSGHRCFAGLAVVNASIAPSHGILTIITQDQTHSRSSLPHA